MMDVQLEPTKTDIVPLLSSLAKDMLQGYKDRFIPQDWVFLTIQVNYETQRREISILTKISVCHVRRKLRTNKEE